MRVLQRQDVDAVRITEFRRLGRKVRLLEIDTGDDSLLVLSRWDLGGDPVRVLDALSEAGYAPGQNPRQAVGPLEIVIDSTTTSSVGRSLRSVGVPAMASTTFWDSGSTTSPKIVWRRLRCGVFPTVMKNCEPFVPGPALAIASR